MTRILTSSMNFMRKTIQWRMPVSRAQLFFIMLPRVSISAFAHVLLFRRTKKKPRRGAFVKQRSLLLSRQNSNALPQLVHVLIAHDPVDQSKESIITPHSNILARMNTGSELAH